MGGRGEKEGEGGAQTKDSLKVLESGMRMVLPASAGSTRATTTCTCLRLYWRGWWE